MEGLMESQGKRDSQGVDARHAIMNAYHRMATEKRLGDINVSSLCKEAGVSRKTFYSHFENIDDVLQQIVYNDVCAPSVNLLPLFNGKNESTSIPLFHERVYTNLMAERDFYTSVLTQNQERIFVRAFQRALRKCHVQISELLGGRQDEEFRYCSAYLAAAQAALIIEWIRGGMKTPTSTLTRWFGAWSDIPVHIIGGAAEEPRKDSRPA